MPKVYIIVLLIYFAGTLSSQTSVQLDSITNIFCESLRLSENHNFEEKFSLLFEELLLPFLDEFDSNELELIATRIDLRLQRNCEEYNTYVNIDYEREGDWLKAEKNLRSNVSKKRFEEIFEINMFKYLEPTGDTVSVYISKEYWLDYFNDGTYSKSNLNQLKNNKFELEFLHSNNLIRSNYCKKGDKFTYTVIEDEGDCFLMLLDDPSTKFMSTFKLYYSQ